MTFYIVTVKKSVKSDEKHQKVVVYILWSSSKRTVQITELYNMLYQKWPVKRFGSLLMTYNLKNVYICKLTLGM